MIKKLKIALRQNAIFIPKEWILDNPQNNINETTSVFLIGSMQLGFTFTEKLLHEINNISPSNKIILLQFLKDAAGVNKNWTPLIKQWDNPTGETVIDHIKTMVANVFKSSKGTTLRCGHIIPDNSFPLERYNGCPYCGTPFDFEALNYTKSDKLKTLDLWDDDDMKDHFVSLLKSPVSLDASQIDSLKLLLRAYKLPMDNEIRIKETKMIVIDGLVAMDRADMAGQFFNNPNDVLRYLWYTHTGFLQIIRPKVIAKRLVENASNRQKELDEKSGMRIKAISDLKLKFSRKECRMYATWLNELDGDTQKYCEIMHPKRSIWVRVIRALRLSEYGKKTGYKNLSNLLDVFYNQNYTVWQGKVEQSKLKSDSGTTFTLLKQRPGLFARSLFSTMLWFGARETLHHFELIMDKVPVRLIFTLNMYADIYFDKSSSRNVKPLGGISINIPANKMLGLYSEDDLLDMKTTIKALSLKMIKRRMEQVQNRNKTIFIADQLFNIPLAIGDRNNTIQDGNSTLMGERFRIEGDTVRLFLQWGEGLKSQHLDMDLSCFVTYANKTAICSYSQLKIDGCKHSGDIQVIPDRVGTAEYIDVNIDKLKRLNAKYVIFTCNAYTNGSLEPNLVVGWMNSKHKMKISNKGVAYNPSDVQHQVRINNGIAKGMAFGVIDVQSHEIIWLEMEFGGQVARNMDLKAIESLLAKLEAKIKIGEVLKIKAKAQGLSRVTDVTTADEVYDMKWAKQTAVVSDVLLGS